MAILESVARLLLLVAGLLGPGALLLRALRLPPSLAGAFAGSAVVLHGSLVGLAACSVPVTLGSLAICLVTVSLGAALALRRRAVSEPATAASDFATLRSTLGWGWPLYLLFWLVVVYRVTLLPLSGPDVDFRWSWLAEEILRQRTLDFYPPHRVTDFTVYFWPESIPPGVAALYAWAYAAGGSFLATWTSPVVLLQFVALYELLWRIAVRLGGTNAARAALFAAAACPLLNWSLFIGQETGLTTMALVGLAYALLHAAETGRASWAVLAGLFAAVGASAREYGPVFPALGALAFLATPRARRLTGCFLLTASPLMIFWLTRGLLRTGNPFYSLGVGSIFPTNAFFTEWRQFDREQTPNPLGTLVGLFAVLRVLVLFAPAALAGWLALALSRGRAARLALAATVVFLGLWWWSVPYTVGGLFYSQRVTAPAVALGALAAAVMLGRVRSPLVPLGLAGLLAITLPQTLTLPENAWRLPFSDWPGLAREREATRVRQGQTAAIAAALKPGTTLIAADNAGHQARFLAHGVNVIPLWSPSASWLFNPSLDDAAVRRLWRDQPVRYVLLARFASSLDFLQRRARWNSPPFITNVAWEDPYAVLLQLDLVPPAAPPH